MMIHKKTRFKKCHNNNNRYCSSKIANCVRLNNNNNYHNKAQCKLLPIIIYNKNNNNSKIKNKQPKSNNKGNKIINLSNKITKDRNPNTKYNFQPVIIIIRLSNLKRNRKFPQSKASNKTIKKKSAILTIKCSF